MTLFSSPADGGGLGRRAAALLGERREQWTDRRGVGPDAVDHVLGRVADDRGRQHGERRGGGDGGQHDHLGSGRLQRRHLIGQGAGQGRRVVRLLRHDRRRRDLHAETLHHVLAELVVLVEVADLLPGEVGLYVGAEDLAVHRVRRLPAEAVGVLGVAPAIAARLNEELRHLLLVQEGLDGSLGRGPEGSHVGEDVVLQDELPGQRGRVGRVVGVVEVGVLDLPPVHAAVRVDPVEDRVHGRGDLVVARCGRPGQGHRGPDGDL